MKRIALLPLAAIVLVACQDATQPTVADAPDASVSLFAGFTVGGFTVGGFDLSRGGFYSFPSGGFLDQTRASLNANFTSVSFTSFSSLTSTALAGVDILMLASATSNNSHIVALSPAEQTVLRDFVEAGGCAVLFPDNNSFGGGGTAAANESLIDPFGMDIAGTLVGKITATVASPSASPVTSGPFGTISSFSQNWPGGLTNLGPYATSLATNSLGDALAVIDAGAITSGSGRVVVYTDVNSFGDLYAFGFFTENENLFLNTIDFCLPVVVVEIDIKPGSDPNCFNINGRGVIPVAILGSADLDVSEINVGTLSFGGLAVRVRGKGPLCHVEDTNGDLIQDLVCQFEDDPNVWAEGNATATLTGELLDGTPFQGEDQICIVP